MWTDMWEDEMLTQQNTKLLGEWKIVKPLVRFSPLVMQKVKCSLRVKPEDRSCCQFCLLTKTFGHYIKNPLTHQAQTERSRSSVLSHGLNVLYLELQFNSLHTATVHADVSMLMSYSALAIRLWSSWSIIMIMWSVWSEETLGCWVRGSQASAGFSHSRLLHWPMWPANRFCLQSEPKCKKHKLTNLMSVGGVANKDFINKIWWLGFLDNFSSVPGIIHKDTVEYFWEILEQTTLCMAESY